MLQKHFWKNHLAQRCNYKKTRVFKTFYIGSAGTLWMVGAETFFKSLSFTAALNGHLCGFNEDK